MPDIKLWTNELENEFCHTLEYGTDTPNAALAFTDPGYITLGQLFLATTKIKDIESIYEMAFLWK